MLLVSPIDLSVACMDAGLSPEDVRQQLHIPIRTWRRYRSQGCPMVIILWLRLRAGDIGQLHPAWTGWKINPRSGLIISPGGYEYSAGHINAIYWRQEQVAALQAKIRRLERELAMARDQSSVSADPVISAQQ